MAGKTPKKNIKQVKAHSGNLPDQLPHSVIEKIRQQVTAVHLALTHFEGIRRTDTDDREIDESDREQMIAQLQKEMETPPPTEKVATRYVFIVESDDGMRLLSHGQTIEDNIDVLVQKAADRFLKCITTWIHPELLPAVLARETWLNAALDMSVLLATPLSDLEPIRVRGGPHRRVVSSPTSRWPLQAKPADVLAWAEAHTNAVPVEELRTILNSGKFLYPWKIEAELLSAAMVANLYLAEQEVQDGRRKPSIAVDAGRPHHEFLGGLIALPKHSSRKTSMTKKLVKGGWRYELIVNGQPRQLQLTFPESTPNEEVLRQIRDVVGAAGLRHWAAIQTLFSIEGNRQGFVRWNIEDHHRALGYTQNKARTRAVQDDTISIVRTFTRFEISAIDKDGRERERRALVLVGGEFERRDDDAEEWRLQGLELTVNPLLYSGVRNHDTKRLSNNYWPQDARLAKINHQRYPYAHGLGLLLPIRWRWAANDNRDHIDVTGSTLLAMAGIPVPAVNPQRAWTSLNKTLQELMKHDCLGRFQVEDREGGPANSLWRLYPPKWQTDRVLRHIAPEDIWCDTPVLTGEQLRQWREERQISQANLSATIGVHRTTIARAELRPDAKLGRRLREAMQAIRL